MARDEMRNKYRAVVVDEGDILRRYAVYIESQMASRLMAVRFIEKENAEKVALAVNQAMKREKRLWEEDENNA